MSPFVLALNEPRQILFLKIGVAAKEKRGSEQGPVRFGRLT